MNELYPFGGDATVRNQWTEEAVRLASEGHAPAEIARALGKHPGTVRMALHRNRVRQPRLVTVERPEVLREVAVSYLRSPLTRGYATLDTRTLNARLRTNCPELFRALKQLQTDSLVILGAHDSTAIDVALTASGLGAFLAGGGR